MSIFSKMKNKYIVAISLLLACLFQGCQQDDMVLADKDADNSILLTAQIGSASTRMSQISDNTYEFDAGDTIQVIGWTGEFDAYPEVWNNNSAEIWWINSINIFYGRKWIATPYMRWQNGEDIIHNFVSWWPAGIASSTADNLRNVSHVTTDTYNPDILVARASLVRPADNKVALQFGHLLSLFDVHLQFDDYYKEVNNVSVTAQLITDATIDLIACEASCGATQAAVAIDEVAPSNGAFWSGSRIVVPQQADDCAITINFTANGKMYEKQYAHPSLLFEQGRCTSLSLFVSKNDVVHKGVGVNPWGDTDSLGDADAE